MAERRKKIIEKMVMDDYAKQLKKSLSDSDIRRVLGQATPILTYPELKNYSTMEQLLPKDKSFVVLLIETKQNSGHWICIMRYGNIIEYFDSYGYKPDNEFNLISKATQALLGEKKHYMTELIKTIPKDIKFMWNKTRLQEMNDNVDDCGRWVCFRIEMMRFGYTLSEFIEFIQNAEKDTGKPADILMCDWIKV